MALDIEQLKVTVAAFHNADGSDQWIYLECARQSIGPLREALPALSDPDRAAVAYYIAGLAKQLRDIKVREISDVVTDTAIGYALGAAQLLGMLEEPA